MCGVVKNTDCVSVWKRSQILTTRGCQVRGNVALFYIKGRNLAILGEIIEQEPRFDFFCEFKRACGPVVSVFVGSNRVGSGFQPVHRNRTATGSSSRCAPVCSCALAFKQRSRGRGRMLPALGRSHAHRISPSLAGRSNYKAGRPNYSGFLEDEWEGRGPSQTRSKSTPLVRRPKETGWNLPTSARMDAELAEEELYFRGGGERGGGEKYAPYRGGGGGGGRPAVDAFPQVGLLERPPCLLERPPCLRSTTEPFTGRVPNPPTPQAGLGAAHETEGRGGFATQDQGVGVRQSAVFAGRSRSRGPHSVVFQEKKMLEGLGF